MRTRKGERPTVAVIGAGFGGLSAVRALRKAPVDVVVIDRHNYHLFAPLLYQVGTSLLDPSEIAQPVRAILREAKNAEFHLADVQHVDLEHKRLETDRGPIPYDYLVVSSGSMTNFFGNRSIEQGSIGLKTLDDALLLRNEILKRFESAKWETDPEERKRLLTFVVVGGGSTGIECAGALSELVRYALRKDFKEMTFEHVDIVLLEASDTLLAPYVPKLREAARRRLEKMHVRVMLNTAVEKIGEGDIQLADGTLMPAGLVVWTAGVCGGELADSFSEHLVRGRRVAVDPTLQLPGHPEAFVIGDLAAVKGEDGNYLPMLAPAATQGGKRAARNIMALIEGREPEPLEYLDKGIMSTIGRHAALVQAGPLKMKGFMGWLTWLFVHLLLIVSFRSQISILTNWVWNWLINDRPARIIVKGPYRKDEPAEALSDHR